MVGSCDTTPASVMEFDAADETTRVFRRLCIVDSNRDNEAQRRFFLPSLSLSANPNTDLKVGNDASVISVCANSTVSVNLLAHSEIHFDIDWLHIHGDKTLDTDVYASGHADSRTEVPASVNSTNILDAFSCCTCTCPIACNSVKIIDLFLHCKDTLERFESRPRKYDY